MQPEETPRRRWRRREGPRTVIDLGKPLRFDEVPSAFGDGFVPPAGSSANRGSSKVLAFALVATLAFAGGAAVQKRQVKGYLPPDQGLAADLEAQERAAQAERAAAAAINGTVVSVTGDALVVRDAQGVERTVDRAVGRRVSIAPDAP
jgi:hypothetical protein